MNSKNFSKSIFKKRHLVEMLSIVVLLILASAFKISTDQLKEESTEGLATLSVNFEDQNRIFEGEVFAETTVLDALNAAMKVGRIKLTYFVNEDNMTWIMEIDGHINQVGGKEFIFYLNGDKLDIHELNKTKVRPGDHIIIKFE